MNKLKLCLRNNRNIPYLALLKHKYLSKDKPLQTDQTSDSGKNHTQRTRAHTYTDTYTHINMQLTYTYILSAEVS